MDKLAGIKGFINEQMKQLPQHKAEELAKIEGFYQGAGVALGAVVNYIDKAEKEEKAKTAAKKATTKGEVEEPKSE